jgi:hypothetical protein
LKILLFNILVFVGTVYVIHGQMLRVLYVSDILGL